MFIFTFVDVGKQILRYHGNRSSYARMTPALRRLYTLGELSYMGATFLHRRSIDSSTFNKIERITGECHL